MLPREGLPELARVRGAAVNSPPLPPSAVTAASLSDVGRVRTRNEDSCGHFENSSGFRLWVVADGMGGHRGGATASRLAVDTMGEVFSSFTGDPEVMLRLALQNANERVFVLAGEDPELRGMGTTAVSLLLGPASEGWVAHVGDSRAYRWRAGRIEALTRDHSVVAEMERRGLITAEEAAVHPRRNEILRSVGVQAEIEPEVCVIEVQAGDRFLLCSDGLSGLVSDAEIEAIVSASAPASAAQTLIDTANERGGHDNITVQIVSVRSHDHPGLPSAIPSHVADSTEAAARTQRQRIRIAAVAGVLLAGLAALALLWRIHSSQTNAVRDGNVSAPADANER